MGQEYFCWQAYWKRSFSTQNSGNTDKSKSQPHWTCKICAKTGKHQTGIKKLTTVYGQQRDVALCLGQCFKNYHSIMNYLEWPCQANSVHLKKRLMALPMYKLFYLYLWPYILLYQPKDTQPRHPLSSVSSLFFFARNVRKAYTFVCPNLIFSHKKLQQLFIF